MVIWRACRIARESTELYSTIVAAGVIAWFAFQSFENIGMTLGIMPVAGLPLPFVSYGGTSMFAVWIAVGLLQSIRSAASRLGLSGAGAGGAGSDGRRTAQCSDPR